MAADPALRGDDSEATLIGEQKVLVVSLRVRSKGLLLAAEKPQRLYLQGQGLDLFHKDFPQ